jgi:hypothetical protein
MKASLFRLTRALLCLLAGGLLSLIELGFFQDAGIISPTFFVVVALTVPTVFLYLRSRESVLVLLSYALILVFLLEGMGRRIAPWHLLACLSVLALLYIQTQLMESASRTERGPSAAGLAFPAALLCCVLVALSTFQVYRLVLAPNLPEGAKFALLTRPAPVRPSAAPERSADAPAVPTPDSGGALIEGEKGEVSPPLKPPAKPIRPGALLLAAASAAACILAGAVALKYLRYRRWLRRTLAAPRRRQIAEFYRHCLRCLDRCGWARQPHETPLEYLEHAQSEGFLFPQAQFGAVTEAFLSSFYGGEEVPPDLYETCLALFRSVPRLVREKKGRRFYYLHYLRKMY